MANLVQLTDLKGLISIDQSNNTLKTTLENSIIPQLENKYLIMLLGENLYNEFIAGLDVVDPETISQKWIDLMDGCNFVSNDLDNNPITLKWLGFANMLKYFVFYEYSAYIQNQNTSSGLIQLTPETGILVGVNQVICNQFNDGVKLFGCNILEFNSRLDKRVSFNFNNLDGMNAITFNQKLDKELNTASAFNFLYQTTKTDNSIYQNWRFDTLEKINIYGI
jgi:hypothetical protein